MSKIKNTTIPILIQILFCVTLFIFPFYLMFRSGELEFVHFSMFFLRMVILIVAFYVNYLILIDKFFFNKNFALYVGLNIALIVILLSCQNLLADVIFSHHSPDFNAEIPQKPKGQPNPYMRYWGDILIFILVIGLSVALKVTLRWYTDSINMEKIKAAQLETDLRNLRNQLNPHFLFNTLNNIYSLIAMDGDKAQSSVLRLSNLLRYMLYENDSPFVPLSRDLDFTQNYIDLMKLRLGPNVKLDVSIINNDSQDMVAPLIFMTLIENAFKHGIGNGDDSFIDINILVEKGKGVICLVNNSVSDSENLETKNSGIGLPNLKKRLSLLYPNRHDLIITEDDNCFSVQLRLNFDNLSKT